MAGNAINVYMSNPSSRQRWFIAIGVIAATWPLIIDAADLSCVLSPRGCTRAASAADLIVLCSLVTGCFLIAFGIEGVTDTRQRPTSQRLLSTLLLTVGLSFAAYVCYSIVTFSRDFSI